MALVKQHLIVGNYADVKDYFNKVKPFVEGVTDVHGVDDLFEIPTKTIKDQLEAINNINGLKVGLVFYFVRRITNGEVFIQLGQEMVWIIQDVLDFHFQEKMGEIYQHQCNVEFMKKK